MSLVVLDDGGGMSKSEYYEHLYDSDIGYILKCINEVFPPYRFISSTGTFNDVEEWHQSMSKFGNVDIVIKLTKHKKTGVLMQIDVKKEYKLVYYAYAGEWVDIHHLKQVKDDLSGFRNYNG